MKKKMLAATVFVTMTMSTAVVFASSAITGDARIEYIKDSGLQSELTNRIRVGIDSDFNDNLYVHGYLNLNSSTKTGKNNVSLNQIYIGGSFENLSFKAGKQPLFLGKGLLSDIDSSNGLKLGSSIESFKINGLIGKDSGKSLAAADISTIVGQVNFGASYLKKDGTKYYSINTDTKIMENSTLNVEYVKNQDSKAKGYLAEVVFGNVIKKGDINYSISYRNIENGAIDGEYSTNINYNNSKGLKFKTHYKVTDNATLGVYYDMAKNQDGKDKHRTEVEFGIVF